MRQVAHSRRPPPRPHGRGGLTLACRLLPPGLREDVRILYAVFRRLDDLVDEGDPAAAARVAAVQRWAAGGPATSVESSALADLATRHDVPRSALRDFCAGMRADLEGATIETEADLDRYCYRVAGTVGIVVMAMLGTDGDCTAEAGALGIALQRTNVLRDVAEDRRAGRVYLARETLKRFGAPDVDWHALVLDQIERADRRYVEGMAGLPHLRRGRAAVTAAAVTYREILRTIERRPASVLDERAVVPSRRKLVVTSRALLVSG